MKKRSWLTKMLLSLVLLLCLFAVVGLSLNGYVKSVTQGQILEPQAASQLSDVDCILVLGCGVKADGTPSDMLRDRLLTSIDLYNQGASSKLLMSGDHSRKNYDEVNTMKQFAMDRGVPSQDIFMDHAGLSTYESMYRARDIFQAKKIIVVTQSYHLYRALYLAKALGLEAYGVAADQQVYAGQSYRNLREIAARDKDFFTAIFMPAPTYLGEAIPVSGNGDATNDS